MYSEIIHKFLSYLAVCKDHELLDHLLGVYSLLEANVDRHVVLVQLKNYLVFIEYFSVVSSLPAIESNGFEQ